MPSVNTEAKSHGWKEFLKRGYCVWCKEHVDEWKPKRAQPVLAETVNREAPTKRQRQSRTYGGCIDCTVYLCKRGECFKRYHSSNDNK